MIPNFCANSNKSSKFVKYVQRIVSFFSPTWKPTEVLKLEGTDKNGTYLQSYHMQLCLHSLLSTFLFGAWNVFYAKKKPLCYAICPISKTKQIIS